MVPGGHGVAPGVAAVLVSYNTRDLVLLCNAPEQVPGVLDSLQGYVNPSAQLRLTRLHGSGRSNWENLHAAADWQKASALVASLEARPKLTLEG